MHPVLCFKLYSSVPILKCTVFVDAFGDLMEKNLDTSVFPPQEKFQCRACGKQFNDRSNCRRHVKSAHFEEEQVSCSLCGKFYKNKRSAKTHYQYCLKVNKHPPS